MNNADSASQLCEPYDLYLREKDFLKRYADYLLKKHQKTNVNIEDNIDKTVDCQNKSLNPSKPDNLSQSTKVNSIDQRPDQDTALNNDPNITQPVCKPKSAREMPETYISRIYSEDPSTVSKCTEEVDAAQTSSFPNVTQNMSFSTSKSSKMSAENQNSLCYRQGGLQNPAIVQSIDLQNCFQNDMNKNMAEHSTSNNVSKSSHQKQPLNISNKQAQHSNLPNLTVRNMLAPNTYNCTQSDSNTPHAIHNLPNIINQPPKNSKCSSKNQYLQNAQTSSQQSCTQEKINKEPAEANIPQRFTSNDNKYVYQDPRTLKILPKHLGQGNNFDVCGAPLSDMHYMTFNMSNPTEVDHTPVVDPSPAVDNTAQDLSRMSERNARPTIIQNCPIITNPSHQSFGCPTKKQSPSDHHTTGHKITTVGHRTPLNYATTPDYVLPAQEMFVKNAIGAISRDQIKASKNNINNLPNNNPNISNQIQNTIECPIKKQFKDPNAIVLNASSENVIETQTPKQSSDNQSYQVPIIKADHNLEKVRDFMYKYESITTRWLENIKNLKLKTEINDKVIQKAINMIDSERNSLKQRTFVQKQNGNSKSNVNSTDASTSKDMTVKSSKYGKNKRTRKGFANHNAEDEEGHVEENEPAIKRRIRLHSSSLSPGHEANETRDKV